MRASFDKWWLVPLGILATAALITLGIVVFEPSFVGRSSDEAARRAASETTETSEAAADCSGALATDYACHQKRYQDLVHDSGVEAAFAELKDEYEKNEFVKRGCHQMVHVIGHAAAERYGDVPATFSRGDPFCEAGYYHGAMEAVVAKIGADKILNEADTICADLGGHQRYSLYYYDCAHGLGHGFMGVLENELFEALEACDSLTDGREKKQCYDGVFMENLVAEAHTGHPSKYLKADQPLYPCTVMEARYKRQCYAIQTVYALRTQGGDFAKVFGLCGEVEDDFRASCYRGLGVNGAVQSTRENVTDVIRTKYTGMRCMLGEDYEARSNCVVGAVHGFIHHYRSDTQAKALCDSFDADLRAVCLQTVEEINKRIQIG